VRENSTKIQENITGVGKVTLHACLHLDKVCVASKKIFLESETVRGRLYRPNVNMCLNSLIFLSP